MNQEGIGRSRRKAVASISLALSMVMGALLFAELDASATHQFGARDAETFFDDFDPTFVQQSIVLGSPTGASSLGQVVVTEDITVIQGIIIQVNNAPGVITCPNLILYQAILTDALGNDLFVTTFGLPLLRSSILIIQQQIVLLGCPVPSG